MAAKPDRRRPKPTPVVLFMYRIRRRWKDDWSAQLFIWGLLLAVSTAPFFVVLIAVDLLLGEQVRIVHLIALPFEWIAGACLVAAVLAFGIYLNVETTKAIAGELVDLVRGKRTIGTVYHKVPARPVPRSDDVWPNDDWEVEFTDSSGQRRTARYVPLSERAETLLGTRVRVRYRQDLPDDPRHIQVFRTGARSRISEFLLKLGLLGVWAVKISPLPALAFALVKYGYSDITHHL